MRKILILLSSALFLFSCVTRSVSYRMGMTESEFLNINKGLVRTDEKTVNTSVYQSGTGQYGSTTFWYFYEGLLVRIDKGR
jgi:hypothetical protein